jgi:hypothetical protein
LDELTFANAIRLLPVGGFEEHAIDFEEIALHHAGYG